MTAQTFSEITAEIRTLVAAVNDSQMGPNASYHDSWSPTLTSLAFGYIGNCDAFASNDVRTAHDDRAWYAFMPRAPWGAGTAADRIGGFRTGDVDAAARLLARLEDYFGSVR